MCSDVVRIFDHVFWLIDFCDIATSTHSVEFRRCMNIVLSSEIRLTPGSTPAKAYACARRIRSI